MTRAVPSRSRRTPISEPGALRFLVGLLVSIGALAATLWWLFSSFLLAVLECDDTCGYGQEANAGYQTQVLLAVAGAILGLLGLTFGLRSQARTAFVLVGLSLVCAMLWFWWVTGGL